MSRTYWEGMGGEAVLSHSLSEAKYYRSQKKKKKKRPKVAFKIVTSDNHLLSDRFSLQGDVANVSRRKRQQQQ